MLGLWFPCICETRLTWVQREGWRVYSSDMGYVPWKVRHPFHYPHLSSDQFLRWGFMVIFWNLAGVPFVSICFTSLLNDPDSPVVLYIFRRIHGIAWARELPFLDNRILHPLRYTPDGLLRVGTLFLPADVDAHESNAAGTLAWRKRVISRCRLKVSTNSVKHSPSSPGTRYRTLHSSKQNMGKTYLLSEDVYCWPLEGTVYWQVVGGHSHANPITLQIGSWALRGVLASVPPPLSHISIPCFLSPSWFIVALETLRGLSLLST